MEAAERLATCMERRKRQPAAGFLRQDERRPRRIAAAALAIISHAQ
jgi:hypothetical protein